jgi:Mce-associated membrane protein
MAEMKWPPQGSVTSKAEAMALLEEAEAEAAEAEARAAAAHARTRAARLRCEALTGVADDHAPNADARGDGAVEGADAATAEDADESIAPRLRLAGWRRRLPSLPATAKVAAIVLICALAGISGYMVWQDREATQREQREANFIAGAKQGIVNMISLDFNRAKEDVQRVIDSSTGQFRDDFQQRAKDFTSVVEQSKVVTQGTVTAAGLESMDAHSASVLIAATSRITNSAGAKDEPRMWRLRVTVTEEGGQYKMSKVDFVP